MSSSHITASGIYTIFQLLNNLIQQQQSVVLSTGVVWCGLFHTATQAVVTLTCSW